jgi:uncharacterized membrane protein
LITGLFFTKYFSIKLWDYSDEKLNYKGIICPLYSFYWIILSLFFYYLLFPIVGKVVFILLSYNILFFCLGIFFGIFITDLSISFKLSYKIRKMIKRNKRKFKRVLLSFKEFKERTRLNINLSKKAREKIKKIIKK